MRFRTMGAAATPSVPYLDEAGMARHYTLRYNDEHGKPVIVHEVGAEDDLAALAESLRICEKQLIEIWEGRRHVGAIELEGQLKLDI